MHEKHLHFRNLHGCSNNLSLEDSLNELAYKDDNQIVSINAEKKYGLADRIIIVLEEIIEE